MCNSFNPLLIIGLLNLFISFSLFALFFQLRCEDIKFYAEQRKFLLYNYTETYQKTIELFNGKNDNIWREINKFIIYNDLLPITTFFLISGFFCLAFSQFTGSNMSYDQSRTNDLEQNKKEIFYNFFIKNKQKLQQVFKEMDKQLYRILFKDEFILFFIGTIFGISSLFYSFMIYDQRQKWKKFYKILEQWEKEEEEKKLKKNLTV
uniref:Transmembrane protein n=1 Tax=Meloidogyne hapla TaxID=6305 RepID=A0A1I8C343_MELHA